MTSPEDQNAGPFFRKPDPPKKPSPLNLPETCPKCGYPGVEESKCPTCGIKRIDRIASVASRGIGLVLLSVLAWQVLARGVSFSSPGIILGILDGANFIFHEAGHILFWFFGKFLQILGGSLTQVAIPAMCTGYFVLHHRPSAAAATLFWTGESITHVAIYITDARLMRLPLHGGGAVIHDWNYLFARLGLVNQSEILGRLAFVVGAMTIFSALGLLTLDLLRRWNQPDGQSPGPDDPLV